MPTPVGHRIFLKVIGKTEAAEIEKLCFNYEYLTDPEVSIFGEGSSRIASGSNLNLTCNIRPTSSERKVLKWTQNGQVGDA